MHIRRLAFGAVALTTVVTLASPSLGAAPDDAGRPADAGVVPGQYIVSVVDGASPRSVAADHADDHAADVLHVYELALRGYAARLSPQAAARIADDPRVASVVADHVVSIAARKPGGGGTQPAQTTPTGVTRIAGPGTATIPFDVAVLDTGVERTHADLTVVGGTSCITGETWDTDGNGHGTHVAGTIAAKNNTIGVVGVAPGARIRSVKVLSRSGSGSWSSVICGIEYVTRNASAIKVANMSLGGTGAEGNCADGGLHQAICASVAAGVTYAVAAGNDAADAAGHVPARYDEVITVSALADFDGLAGGLGSATCRTDADDTFASFSNYGSDVDVIAPGVCIRSTWKGGSYNTISGTSMATPHVAGAAALYKAANPGATPAAVKTGLQSAGTLDWDDADDPDATKERLLRL